MKSVLTCLVLFALGPWLFAAKPNIIFVMADDMGWGQTSFRGHPLLKTPNLDAMAANGLRFERFYAGNPVCSPTRATVLTGRTNDRAGVLSHGYALRLQEKTIAQALKGAGYVTGHFGKWHLNGFKGPGAPVLRDDPRSPGAFGFDEWTSVTNFFDQNPLMSRGGEIVEFKGDSSEVAVGEAIAFIDRHRADGKPLFAIIWFGTPHSPFKALEADKAAFSSLDKASANHHGELVAMDRAVGTLRRKLRDAGLADNTMLVFNSDNGGLPEVKPDSVGGLRGKQRQRLRRRAARARHHRVAGRDQTTHHQPSGLHARFVSHRRRHPRSGGRCDDPAHRRHQPEAALRRRNRRQAKAPRLPLRQQGRTHRPALQDPHREH
jgi:arylsulfatase A-like enzyme